MTICRGLLLNPDGKTESVEKLHLTKVDSYYKCDKTFNINPKEENKYYIYPLLTNKNNEYKFSFIDNTEIKKTYPEIIINMTNMQLMYHNLSKYYDASKIYNDGKLHDGIKKEILIAKILTPYIGKVNPRIKDFKIFYLFSNESLDIKCFAQANLLELTDNFIKAIIPE
jgi:hypothetical protein